MRAVLFFPPHWSPVMPHLALPVLTAALREKGVEVIQRDLNIEFFRFILSPHFLSYCEERLTHTSAPSLTEKRILQPSFQKFNLEITRAIATITSSGFFDEEKCLNAFIVIDQALSLISRSFPAFTLSLTDLSTSFPVDRSSSLKTALEDPDNNLFIPFLKKEVLPDLLANPPDVIGISVPTINQFFAALTLAQLIKANHIPSHIVLGGPHITILREQLKTEPSIFCYVDSCLPFDGEENLFTLIQCLNEHLPLSSVPNLIYLDTDKIVINPPQTPSPAVTKHPLLPDFSGLPLNQYLTPELILPLSSSIGCYHGKCAFCNVGYGASQPYHYYDPQWIADQMLALKEIYGARHIFFSDEAMFPSALKKMASALEKIDNQINWCGCVRFDSAFSTDLLSQMSRGGCRMLLFGLETAAPITMSRMIKGTQQAIIQRILSESALAGIWNHTFFFFGFPGETIERAQETVNFVYANKHSIHSASPGAFLLEKYSPTYLHPDRFGIKKIVNNPEKDLALYYDYSITDGLSEEEANDLAERFIDVLPDRKFGQYYINDAYRLLFAAHLHQKGVTYPTWLSS